MLGRHGDDGARGKLGKKLEGAELLPRLPVREMVVAAAEGPDDFGVSIAVDDDAACVWRALFAGGPRRGSLGFGQDAAGGGSPGDGEGLVRGADGVVVGFEAVDEVGVAVAFDAGGVAGVPRLGAAVAGVRGVGTGRAVEDAEGEAGHGADAA